ncbi:MAG: hypothetical protein AAF558_03905 [Verrucomicrobiota bacterium]
MNFKKLIKSHYDAQVPSKSLMKQIEAMQPEQSSNSPFLPILSRGLLAAATLVILSASAWWFWIGSLQQSIAGEIAMHHLEHKALDVVESDYAVLASKMPRLNFDLDSSHSRLSSYRLEGGRYCALRQRLAAQLRIRHIESGREDTLYVVPARGELKRITRAFTKEAGDVTVHAWNEGNRFFALAQTNEI